MKNKTFCILPWIHLHIKPNKDVHLCSRKSIPLGNIKDIPINDIFNGKTMNIIRNKMKAGLPVEGCEKCYHCESLNDYSMRKMVNLWFKEYIINNNIISWKNDIIPDDTNYNYDWIDIFKNVPIKLRWVAIHASNICNLSCRGCYSMLSSKWRKDEKILGINPHPLHNENIESFNIDFKNVDFITMFGGEPLIMKQNDQLANILLSSSNVDQKILQYYTNGMVMPNELTLKLWKHIKFLHLNISIDDYNEHNEYFRCGSKWDTIEKNLLNYIKYKKQFNWQISISILINIYNVVHLDILYNWLIKHDISPDNIIHNLCIVPPELDIRNLPQEYKKYVIEKYNSISLPPEIKNLVIKQINQRPNISFIATTAFSSKLDEIRNQSNPNTLLQEYINEY